MPIIVPIQSLHSDSELADAILDVRAKVRGLETKLEDAAPNGRDYYPQGEGAYKKAQTQWALFAKAIAALGDELLWLATPPDLRQPSDEPCFQSMADMSADLLPPTIHLNGTSAVRLREQFKDVYRAANECEEAFRSIVPNGRDYATEQWEQARAEHLARVQYIKRTGQLFLLLAIST
jgi:hypothetical protein